MKLIVLLTAVLLITACDKNIKSECEEAVNKKSIIFRHIYHDDSQVSKILKNNERH